MKRFDILYFLSAIAFSLAITTTSCRNRGYFTTSGMVWNTTYNITYKGSSALEDSILRVIDEVGKSLNVFDSTSLVAAANRSRSPIEVDAHFKAVYETSCLRCVNAAFSFWKQRK